MLKSKAAHTVQTQKGSTRKQLARRQHEARQRRRVLLAVAGMLVLALAMVGYGVLRENVLILDEPVANVNGETISTRDFQARVRLERRMAQQQILQAQTQGDQNTVDAYQQELADPTAMGGQIIQNMVDELLLKQGAKDFGISVSPEELQTYIQEQFGYGSHLLTPAPTPSMHHTPATSNPIAPTPMSLESFQQAYISQVNRMSTLGFSEQSYRNMIEVRLLADKVRQAIASTVPTMTVQVQFRYIGIGTADLPTVTQSIQQDGFDKVYQAVISRTYPITTVEASKTRDWFPRDLISGSTEYGPALANQMFDPTIPLSTTISALNAAGRTNYVVQVYAREIAPLNIYVLETDQKQAIEDWLSQRRKPTFLLAWNDRLPTTP